MTTIGASEARATLPALLKDLKGGGGPVTIERRGKPLAALVSLEDLALIEERRAAEAARSSRLREAYRLFERTEKLARLGHWRWDEIEDRCTYCSRGLANLVGVTPEEYIARTTSFEADVAWAHPEDRERYRAAVTASIRTASAFAIEYRLVRADGAVINVYEESTPIRDEQGRLIASQGYVQDITERKAIMQALRDSEARFRDFAAAASDWFWEMGPDLRFTWISQSYRQEFGYNLDHIIGKTRWDITCEDVETEKWRAHRADLAARRPIRDFRYQVVNDAGELRHRSVSAVPIFDNRGGFQGYRGTATDITVLVNAEQALKAAHDEMGRRVAARTAELAASQLRLFDAIEAISEAFILFDAEERLVLCNEKYRQLMPEMADLLVAGATLEDLLRAAADRGQVTDALGRADDWVRDRLRLYRYPGEAVEYELSDGRWMLARDRRTRDGGIVGIRSDITAERRNQAALTASVQRLQDIAEAASDWFWELDAALRFTYLSDRYREFAGISPEILYGKRWEEVYPQSATRQPEAWRPFLEAVAARRDFRDFTHDDFRQDGIRRVIRNTGKAIFAPDGRFLGYRGTSTDITEQVVAEEELRRTEARFKAVVEHSPSPIYLKDPDGRFRMINRRFAESYGVPDAAAIGKTTDEFVPADYAALYMALDRQVLESGENVEQELVVPFADGSLHQLLTVKFPVKDGAGRVIGVGTIDTDMTERKRAEAAKGASEALFKAFVEHSPTPISIKGLDGRYTVFSPAARRYYKAPVDDAIGKTARDLFAPALADAIEADDRDTLRSGGPLGHDEERIRVYGEDSLLLTKFPIPDQDGEVVGIGTIGVDVTERERIRKELELSEARLAAALRQARIGYWHSAYPDGQITEWSKEAAEILGLAPEDVPLELDDYLAYLHPEDRAAVEEVYRRHLLSPTTTGDYRLEYRFVRPDGEAIWLSVEATAESDPQGRNSGYLGTIQDITANKRAEEQLRHAQKMEAVGQLTGGIAHDFNNLLAIIQGNTEFLLDELGPNDESAQAIKRAAELGAELTRRLLAFSRQQPLQPQPIDLDRLVAGMSDLLSRSLGETIEVVTAAEPDLWTATADPGQVQNALLNLAINARDAMPDGGRLTITCDNAALSRDDLPAHPEVAAGDYVRLSVRDSGIGMSQEVLERAFEPFFTTKDFGQGSGLGLSMVYGFARQSDGFVTLASQPGEGTCARLFLPRLRGPRDEAAVAPAIHVPGGHGERVLVIEDDDQVRRIAMKILKGLGYRVFGVPEAASAWSRLEGDTRIELVLSDVVLPGGESGIAFARALAQRFPEIGIVFMSGYPADVAARDGGLDGSKILLNKPFERVELATAVRQVLDSRG